MRALAPLMLAAIVALLAASAAAQIGYSTSGHEYRLVGGSHSLWGRLEARTSSSGTWGTVCDDNFDSNDAYVACKSVGHTTVSSTQVAFRTATSSERGSSSQPIVLGNLACSGSEATLDACSRGTTSSCTHFDDLVLNCGSTTVPSPPATAPGSQSTSSWEYQLADMVNTSTTTSGRLEAKTISTFSWGVVCDGLFSSNDAIVACRSLGLSTSFSNFARVTTSQRGSSTAFMRMDGLLCDGTEAALDACRQQSIPTCSYTEAVWLTCGHSTSAATTTTATTTSGVASATTTSAPGGSSSTTTTTAPSSYSYRLAGGNSTYGRLEVRTSATGAWGTVCDDYFGSADAAVACRSLGFNSYVTYATAGSSSTGLAGSSSQPIYMDDLFCAGTESTLDQCSRASSHNCVHSEDVVLSCQTITAAPGATVTTQAISTWQFRLVGGSEDTWGRLEVRASSTATWGTVCDDAFDANDAIVACRSMNMPTSVVSWRTSRAAERGADSQSITMDDLACTGSESTLDQCSRASSHNCGHYEDVILSCGTSAVPAPDATAASAAGGAVITDAPRNFTVESADGCSGTCAGAVVFGLLTLVVPIIALVVLFFYHDREYPFLFAAGGFFIIMFGPCVVYNVAFANPGLEYLDRIQQAQADNSRNASSYDPEQHTSCLALDGTERPYFKPCGLTEYAFLGTFGETVSKRCCAPADRVRKCEDLPPGITLIPAGREGDSACCPRIAGNRVPQAFLMMMIAALGGLVSKIVINTLAWLVRQCCKQCESEEDKRAAGEEEDLAMEFVEGLTSLSTTVLVTATLSYLLGYALSIYSAASQEQLFGMHAEGWARYNIFVSFFLGGGGMKALIGSAASCFVMVLAEENFEVDTDTAAGEDAKDQTRKTIERLAMLLLPMSALTLPMLITHIIPGIFLYLPLLTLVAALAVGVALGWTALFAFLADKCDGRCAQVAIRLVFQFGLLIIADIALNSIVRVPGEIMVINYGGSDFPYKSVGQSHRGLAAVAGMWHAPFYYMQMASPTCFFRTAFTSADSAIQNVLTLLN